MASLWNSIIKGAQNNSRPTPVPQNVAERYRRNTRKQSHDMYTLKQAIKSAPIFVCSTHGDYDRSRPIQKKIVPPNTWIFEAQSIGDLTLTNIDYPLWDLLQGGQRWGFLRYLTNDTDAMKAKGIPIRDDYKKVFANLIMYKPGDEIYERVLSIGGGRGARKPYENMGFYRFDANGPKYDYRGYGRRLESGLKAPYEILPNLQRQLVENPDRQITDCLFMDYMSGARPFYRSGEPIGEDFWTALPPDYRLGQPRIFIFSSCAAVSEDNTPEGVQRWVDIAQLQRERILESWAMGLHSLGGGSGAANSGSITLLRDSMDLRAKSSAPQSFLPPHPEDQLAFSLEDSELNPSYLYNVRGGSRKSLRKFKKTRKNNVNRNRTL